FYFFLYCCLALRHLPSFPTRRSSDLPFDHARCNFFKGIKCLGLDWAFIVERLPERVHHTAQQRLAHGNGKKSAGRFGPRGEHARDRKSTRLNSSHLVISYAVFCLKKK